MKKKYIILALTFLCLLIGQISYSQPSSGDYQDTNDVCDPQSIAFNDDLCDPDIDITNDPCDIRMESYNPCECDPSSCDPCNPFNSNYDPMSCTEDSGNVCDESSSAYNPTLCGYSDTGNVCDPFSSAYNYLACYNPGGTGGGGGGGGGGTPSSTMSNILNGLNISNSTKAVILSLAEGDVGKLGTFVKGFGHVLGFISIATALDAYISNPTTANLIIIAINLGSLTLGPGGGFVMALSDTTGLTNTIANSLGALIDNTAGYSVGQSFSNDVELMFN